MQGPCGLLDEECLAWGGMREVDALAARPGRTSTRWAELWKSVKLSAFSSRCSCRQISLVEAGRNGERGTAPTWAEAHHPGASRDHRDSQLIPILIRIRRPEGEGKRPKIRPKKEVIHANSNVMSTDESRWGPREHLRRLLIFTHNDPNARGPQLLVPGRASFPAVIAARGCRVAWLRLREAVGCWGQESRGAWSTQVAVMMPLARCNPRVPRVAADAQKGKQGTPKQERAARRWRARRASAVVGGGFIGLRVGA